MARPKIHLNVTAVFPSKLKALEIGLCLAEVNNPKVSMIWDDLDMGFFGRTKLRGILNVCMQCVESLPAAKDGEISYLFGFREKEKVDLLDSVSVEGE